MAGRSSVEVFKKLEINTIGDLAHADVNVITLHLKSHGRMLWNFANGIGDDKVQYEPEEAKGVGNSTTLSEDATTYEEAREVFHELAQSVGNRLKKAGKKAGMVSTAPEAIVNGIKPLIKAKEVIKIGRKRLVAP